MKSTIFIVLFCAACVPVPYLTPPSHISVDLYPNVEFVEEERQTEEPLSTNIAFGIAPLSSFPNMSKRNYDVYGGLFLHSSERLGPYIGVDYWPSFNKVGSRVGIRAGFTGRAAILTNDIDWGTHYKAGLTAEILTNLRAEDLHLYQKDYRSIGILFGELGMGVDLCMFVDEFEDSRIVGGLFSMDFRIPTGAGVTFVPLEKFSK